LKGKFVSGKANISLRSTLVVFQFFISITLIVCATVVYKQLYYIQNKDLGYDRSQVIILPPTWMLGKNTEAFRSLVLQDAGVTNASVSNYVPAGPSTSNNFGVYPDHNSTQLLTTLKYEVDPSYIPVMGMQITAGRNFSKDFSTDSAAMIINEAAAREFGWQNNALGHMLTSPSGQDNKPVSYKVIGIVKDFHFKSMHERISPLVMVLSSNPGFMIVKAQTKDIQGLLASLKKQWTAMSSEPFYFTFLDDRFNDTYQADQRTGRILDIFAGISIFVACLGLFGLAMFTAEQRIKEIGIRKVLGATTTEVVGLLSKEFLKLVIIANLIAWPLAWWAMNKWLQDFAYHTPISWWIFVIAGIVALGIALCTVSYQALKAARMNPTKSLHVE
jgi:putative ABC transport system permease protein